MSRYMALTGILLIRDENMKALSKEKVICYS